MVNAGIRSALDANDWLQPGYFLRQTRPIRGIHHFGNVLVGSQCFLRDAPRRRASNDHASTCQIVNHLPATVVTQRFVATHRAPGAVTRRAKRPLQGFSRSYEHVRRRSHRAANEHRLPHRSQSGREHRMARAERTSRPFAVNEQLLLLAVDQVLFHFARVVGHVIQ